MYSKGLFVLVLGLLSTSASAADKIVMPGAGYTVVDHGNCVGTVVGRGSAKNTAIVMEAKASSDAGCLEAQEKRAMFAVNEAIAWDYADAAKIRADADVANQKLLIAKLPEDGSWTFSNGEVKAASGKASEIGAVFEGYAKGQMTDPRFVPGAYTLRTGIDPNMVPRGGGPDLIGLAMSRNPEAFGMPGEQIVSDSGASAALRASEARRKAAEAVAAESAKQ